MAKEHRAVVELMWNMISRKTGSISRVSYFPQKPEFPQPDGKETHFLRTAPESEGVSSGMLASMIEDLAVRERGDIHQLMVLRNGRVLCECSFSPYQRGVWHITHSMCKSVTGMAVGLLISEGKLSLDDSVAEIFGKRRNILGLFKKKNITVKHLLTMSSGVVFNESGAVSGDEWVKGYLESSIHGTPGKSFEYNSMNSYILSAIITEITGETMMDYLKPRLWEPLGITRVFWECCPQGITKGGWGLFLRTEDAAKLGQLYLQKGEWDGRQIIPVEWVEASTTKWMDTPEELEAFGYGYQVWMDARPGSFNFNGMLGQNVLVYPDMNMVVAINAGSDDFFQSGALKDVISEYFHLNYMPEDILPENGREYRRLCSVIRKMEDRTLNLPVIERGGWKKRKGSDFSFQRKYMGSLNGCRYTLAQRQVGIAPLVMQVFHNNFTDGIHSIGFMIRERKLLVKISEGETEHVFPIGFEKPEFSQIEIHQEPYLIGVKGVFATDEDGRLVLKLDIAFLEEAVRRKLKIFFEGNRIEIHWDETPGEKMILNGLESITADAQNHFIINNLKERGAMEVLKIAAELTIKPVTFGEKTQTELE